MTINKGANLSSICANLTSTSSKKADKQYCVTYTSGYAKNPFQDNGTLNTNTALNQ